MEAALTSSSDDDSRPASIGGLGLLLAREDAPLINPQAMLSFTSRNQWSPVRMLIFWDCSVDVNPTAEFELSNRTVHCTQQLHAVSFQLAVFFACGTELASSHLCVRAW